MKTKYSLTLDVARTIAAAAEAEALRNNWTVVIAILDDAGTLTYLQRLDGTQIASSDIAVQKARAALYFKRSTKVLEDVVTGGKTGMVNLAHITPVEGGLPLVYRNEIVGAIGVSGVLSAQDGVVAKAGADRLLDYP